MRTDWVSQEAMSHVLAALTPENRLVCEVALATGLRISDVLSLQTDKLKQRITVKEQKTGKNRRVNIPIKTYQRMQQQAGRVWVFEGRLTAKKHRTRQAVYKDVKRAAKAFRMPQNVAPHSMRKMYAVKEMKRLGSLEAVQAAMKHRDAEVTMIYAMADAITEREQARKARA